MIDKQIENIISIKTDDWKCLICGKKNKKEYKYCPYCGKAKKIEI